MQLVESAALPFPYGQERRIAPLDYPDSSSWPESSDYQHGFISPQPAETDFKSIGDQQPFDESGGGLFDLEYVVEPFNR